jgi:hypothetical protein
MCNDVYSDWLENIDVPKHLVIRSSGYVKSNCSLCSEFHGLFCEANERINLNKFKIYEDDAIVSVSITNIWSHCKSTSTYNHNTKALKNFNSYLIDKEMFVDQGWV